jgi:hypothetical protein
MQQYVAQFVRDREALSVRMKIFMTSPKARKRTPPLRVLRQKDWRPDPFPGTENAFNAGCT